MEWESHFLPQILERGLDYYRRDLVHDLQQCAGQVTATVTGSQPYRVSLRIQDDQLTAVACDCPYAVDHDYCKHMAAVLYFWEDRGAIGEVPDGDEPAIADVVNQAPEQLVRDVLIGLLANDEHEANIFRHLAVGSDVISSTGEEYQVQMQAIFSAYEDASGFIDYEAATPFAEELTAFIEDSVQNLLQQAAWATAAQLLESVMGRLKTCDIDDSDGEILLLLETCDDAWEKILAQADLPLKQAVFDWICRQLQAEPDFLEDPLKDLLLTDFPEAEFKQPKLDFAERQLAHFRTLSDEWERTWQLEQWVTLELKVLETAEDVTDQELQRFYQAHLEVSQVRQAYSEFCIQRADYELAIAILQAGKTQAQTQQSGRLLVMYSRRLKELYHQLGKTAAYRQELWQLLTAYQPADLATYQELKGQFAAEAWPAERERLFKALPKVSAEVMEKLYAEDHLWGPLLRAVLAEKGLDGVQTYGHLLAPRSVDKLLDKYVAVAEEEAKTVGNRQHYRYLVQLLTEMAAYPGGVLRANGLVQQWRQQYPRRSAMLDELSRFRGI